MHSIRPTHANYQSQFLLHVNYYHFPPLREFAVCQQTKMSDCTLSFIRKRIFASLICINRFKLAFQKCNRVPARRTQYDTLVFMFRFRNRVGRGCVLCGHVLGEFDDGRALQWIVRVVADERRPH